eukprot:jgi/Tetstr1/453098/TSEL_003938.t1
MASGLRLSTLNTYLIASWLSGQNTRQQARAAALGRWAANSDLVFLQEVWGAAQAEVQASLGPAMRMPPDRQPLLPFATSGVLSDILHTLWFRLRGTGGLLHVHRAASTDAPLHTQRRSFTVSRSRSLKGVEATLWSPRQWQSRRLLVFNTHLDPWVDANKLQQLREIRAFVADTVAEVSARRAEFGGDPDLASFWRGIAVLVVGDFNIKSTCGPMYDRMLQLLGGPDSPAQDLYRATASGGSAVAIEDELTYDIAANSLADSAGDSGRIDYVLQLTGLPALEATMPDAAHTAPALQFMQLRCERYNIARQERGQELSDHWGLEPELWPR